MKSLIIVCLTLFASGALAHAGHDHQHWTSDIIHLVAIGAGLSVAALGGYLLLRKRANKKEQ